MAWSKNLSSVIGQPWGQAQRLGVGHRAQPTDRIEDGLVPAREGGGRQGRLNLQVVRPSGDRVLVGLRQLRGHSRVGKADIRTQTRRNWPGRNFLDQVCSRKKQAFGIGEKRQLGYGLFGRQRVLGCRGFQFFKL